MSSAKSSSRGRASGGGGDGDVSDVARSRGLAVMEVRSTSVGV